MEITVMHIMVTAVIMEDTGAVMAAMVQMAVAVMTVTSILTDNLEHLQDKTGVTISQFFYNSRCNNFI
jgi:hypothetical protein